jgi:hypothetical protein
MAERRRLNTLGLPADGVPEVQRDLASALVERAARLDFARFESQLRSSGYCARPVRLEGRIETCDADGRRRVWSTDSEPDASCARPVATAAKPSAHRAPSAIAATPTS